jgi:hypothetical protein
MSDTNNYLEDRLPEGWAMIRCEHPEPIVYTFGPAIDPYTWQSTASTFRFFVTVKQFNEKHGKYEANRRHVIQRVTALYMNEWQREAYRITPDNYLSINSRTMDLIVTQYAMANDGLFEDKDLKRFFEQNYIGLNEAIRWFENYARKRLNRMPRQ